MMDYALLMTQLLGLTWNVRAERGMNSSGQVAKACKDGGQRAGQLCSSLLSWGEYRSS